MSFLNKYYPCEVSEDISKRVLCLPLHFDLEIEQLTDICNHIKSAFV